MARLKFGWIVAAVLASCAAHAGLAMAQQAPPELRGAPDEELPPLGPPGSVPTLPPQTLPQAIPIAPSVKPSTTTSPPIARPTPPPLPVAPRFESARPAERVITPPPATPAAAPPPPRPPAVQRARPAAASPVPVLAPPRGAPTVFASSAAGQERLALAGAPGPLCVSVRGGLGPALEVGGRPAVLAACGAGAAPIRLVDGVLYVGEGRTHHLTPIAAPVSGCRLVDTLSQVRRTLVGVCVDPAARLGAFEEDLRAPGWGRIAAQATASGPAYLAGAPLMVAPVAPESPPTPAWMLVPALEQIATSDGALCFTTPTGDRTAGAPLILKPCGPAAARFSFQSR
jgi:hypothetical protein